MTRSGPTRPEEADESYDAVAKASDPEDWPLRRGDDPRLERHSVFDDNNSNDGLNRPGPEIIQEI
jgi:hypothetical protein